MPTQSYTGWHWLPASSTTQSLEDLGYAVTRVASAQNAIETLREKQAELALLELPLLEQDAHEFIKGLKADNALRNVPLLILADPDKVDHIGEFLKSGAEDLVSLPFNEMILKTRIKSALERQRLRKAEWLLAGAPDVGAG